MQLENQCCDSEIIIFHFYNFGLVIARSNAFPRDKIFFHQHYPGGNSKQKASCVGTLARIVHGTTCRSFPHAESTEVFQKTISSKSGHWDRILRLYSNWSPYSLSTSIKNNLPYMQITLSLSFRFLFTFILVLT